MEIKLDELGLEKNLNLSRSLPSLTRSSMEGERRDRERREGVKDSESERERGRETEGK